MDSVEHLKWVRQKNKRSHNTYLLSVAGWNSWYNVHHNISETVVRQVTDAMVASGLAAAGYEYGIYLLICRRNKLISTYYYL